MAKRDSKEGVGIWSQLTSLYNAVSAVVKDTNGFVRNVFKSATSFMSQFISNRLSITRSPKGQASHKGNEPNEAINQTPKALQQNTNKPAQSCADSKKCIERNTRALSGQGDEIIQQATKHNQNSSANDAKATNVAGLEPEPEKNERTLRAG